MKIKYLPIALVGFVVSTVFVCAGSNERFVKLFSDEGVPENWVVRHWADIKNPSTEGAVWRVKDGILHGSEPRGTWLVSKKEYADFVLKFEFKLGARGNSGVGLRFPMEGDPAFDGLEVQMVDPRYYGDYKAGPEELAGAVYKSITPLKQVYRPEEWNSYEITCDGPEIQVVLNGEKIIDANLDEHTDELERGSSLYNRPRKGHIGFQELSRGGAHVMIRDVSVKVLD